MVANGSLTCGWVAHVLLVNEAERFQETGIPAGVRTEFETVVRTHIEHLTDWPGFQCRSNHVDGVLESNDCTMFVFSHLVANVVRSHWFHFI